MGAKSVPGIVIAISAKGDESERAVVDDFDPNYRTRFRIVAGGNASMVCRRRR